MASTGDFDPDGFASNLFSDLAPLLVLFGEEVTTQFLSMSMGWADNFLLAMGPIGIITIVVSAIRIGGGTRLKSLIGRTRETQAVAEQELLSSTSSEVCELWNGQHVSRLIGEPKGMMTVVLSNDGTMTTLPTALRDRLITTKDNKSKNKQPLLEHTVPDRLLNSTLNDVPTSELDHMPMGYVATSAPTTSNEKSEDVEQEDVLEDNASRAALSLPPNLTLNTRSAPATPREIWSWAGLGLILQAFAVVYPGLATYYFKWNKSEIPVAEYGYPCFAVGTVCLTIGVMLCGRIIEGATQETNFYLDSKSRLLCLQEALPIGEQNMPSCAIFFAEKDGILRTSRRIRGYSKNSYAWVLTIVSIFLALFGYIVQFVGLRALHWSATILQLVVTIIMTITRAYARRNLASAPETSDLALQGHEMAWLALFLMSKRGRKAATRGSTNQLGRRSFSSLWYKTDSREYSGVKDSSYFWELISDHSEESSAMIDWQELSQSSPSTEAEVRDKNGYISNGLLEKTDGPLSACLTFQSKLPPVPASSIPKSPLQFFVNITSSIRKSNVADRDRDIAEASSALCQVIEDVMSFLSSTDGVIIWDSEAKMRLVDKNQNLPLHMFWSFDIREGHISEHEGKRLTRKRCRIGLYRNPDQDGRLWHLDEKAHGHLQAAISLSSYTHAARLMYAAGGVQTTTTTTTTGITEQHNGHGFHRIVGHAKWHPTCDEVEERRVSMQKWLIHPIERSNISAMRNEADSTNLKVSIAQSINPPSTGSAWSYCRMLGLCGQKRTSARGLWEDMGLLTHMLRRGVSSSYLGTFLSSSADKSPDSSQDEYEELYIERDPHSPTTEAFQYAQEMFSLFILALASRVESVNGETHLKHQGNDGGKVMLENSTFKSIAEIVVRRNLASTSDEAYTLIIPAFAKYNLLPCPSDPRDPESLSQRDSSDQTELATDLESTTNESSSTAV